MKVEREKTKKPFLGGYRHKETGAEYHHAAIQTAPPTRAGPGVRLKYNRAHSFGYSCVYNIHTNVIYVHTTYIRTYKTWSHV